MVIKDEHGWRGANNLYYANAEQAHLSFQKSREAAELAKRLQETLSFATLHGYDPFIKNNSSSTREQPSTPNNAASAKSAHPLPRPDQSKWDVALSFAGEDRQYVGKVAAALRKRRVRVFYDRFEEATLWGKDLYSYLRDVYQKHATYTVIFASEHYAKKAWTNHERESAQARAFNETREYILLARFDDTEVPGVPPTRGYIDLRSKKPVECAKLIIEKLMAYKVGHR